GRVTGSVAAFVDVTERTRAEEALRRSEHQLRLVADHAPVLIAHCDREARYKFVNRAYAERFGRDATDVIGRLIPGGGGEAAYESFREHVEAALSGRSVEFEAEIPYRDLGPQFMRVAYAPDVDGAGEVRGLVAAIINITDRKRAEEAANAARADAEAASRMK